MIVFIIVSFAVLIFTALTPEEWQNAFNKVNE